MLRTLGVRKLLAVLVALVTAWAAAGVGVARAVTPAAGSSATLSSSTPGLVALSPARVLDTRNGTGATKGQVAAGKSISV